MGEKIGIAFERALGLEKRSLVRPGVDVDQRIAFADKLAFFVMHGGDDAVDLAGDRCGVNGCDGANGIEIDADVALLCNRGYKTDRAASTPWRFRGSCGSVALAHDEIKTSRKDEKNNNPHKGPYTLVARRRSGEMIFRVCARVLISRQVGDPLS